MKQAWLKGLKEDQKPVVAADFLSSQATRERLSELLQERSAASRKKMLSKDALSNPNWANEQAYRVGYEAAIEEILNLISS